VEDLDTQQHVVNLDTQDVIHLVYAIALLIAPAVLGAHGVLALLARQELAQELALLEILALQLKQSNAGTVQKALI